LNIDAISNFLLMDGHALYIWLSYGMGLVVLVITFIQPVIRRKRIIRDLSQAQRREAQNMSAKNISPTETGDTRL
jgi:heme exporter protein D